MKLASRFNLFLIPMAVGFTIWNVTIEWFDYQDRTEQFAKDAMLINQQELQILSLNNLFTYYFENTRLEYHLDANRDLRDIGDLFRQVFEQIQPEHQNPVRFAFLDRDGQPLVDEVWLGSVHGNSIEPVFSRLKPDFKQQASGSWLTADIHESIIPLGDDVDQDSQLEIGEIKGYVYGAYQLPYQAFVERARKHFVDKSQRRLLEVVVLILILLWVGRTISNPFKDFLDNLKSITSVDFKKPFKQHWSIDELQILANEIEDMRQEILEQQGELIRTRDAALEAAETKSRFLATMSHEIRTPMNGVLGMAQLLGATNLNPQQQQYVDVIHSSGHTLLTIINDILDFSKLEEKQVLLDEFAFELWELILDLEALFNIQINKPDLKIAVDIGSDIPRNVIGDPHRLRQVLFNLIGNAIKFTDSGLVQIRLSLVGGAADTTCIEFAVEDSGVGIPADVIEKLFQPFVQADSSTSRRFGGTGLGLSICDRLISAMGGKIDVSSTPGLGSRFYFTLNFKLPSLQTRVHNEPGPRTIPLPEPQDLFAQASVLVAEDDEINRMYMHELLDSHGFQDFVLVENGTKVLQALELRNFDIIIMDCQMPEMDGYSASREIRRREALTTQGKHVPIIALTANAMPEDRERCLAAGMDDYLVKPLDQKDLHNNLSKWLQSDRVRAGSAKLPVESDPDTAIDLDAFHRQLENLGESTTYELAATFLGELPDRMAEIRELAAAQDREALRSRVHAFKGNCSVVRAMKIGRLCDELLTALQQQPDSMNSLVDRLVDESNEVRKALTSLLPT